MDRTIGKSQNRNYDGERLMISLLEIAQSINEVDDEKVIKYKKKDGESGEMKAGSAKSMPKDHPAKLAWDKMQDDGGDDSEKDSGGKLGGGDFDRDGGGDSSSAGPDPDMKGDPSETEQAIKSAEDLADKYGIESDPAGNEQGLNRANIGAGGEYEGDNQLTISHDDGQYHVGIQGEDAMQGPIGHMSFDSKEEMESALDRILGNEKIKDALKKGDSLEGMKDEIESLGKGGSDDDEEKSTESENEKIIGSLEDMDLDGLNVDSLDSAIDSGQYASITGKDDDPDNEMSVNAFQDGDSVGYAINVGIGHDTIYFDSKEKALESAQKLFKDDKIRKAMDGEGEETLADLGDHAKSIVKGKDEKIKVIDGKKYKAIKESKKNPRILKEIYDRTFRSLK